MQIHQFESDEMRRKDDEDRPWRRHAPPVGKPTNPNNPNNNGPINHDAWMKSSKKMEESSEMPEVGDTIRTKKMQMDGKVERIEGDMVYFRIGDGRLMRSGLDNVTVVEKLADEETEMMEQEINEISNALLTKYKSGAAKSASSADAMGDIKTGNKRFSGIVKATNKQFANDAKARAAKSDMKEGSMGGINRSRPAVDVSYEKVLDRNPKSAHSKVVGEQQVNELSVEKMQAYKAKAASPESFRTRPLRKLAKSSQTVNTVDSKINSKINKKRQGMKEGDNNTSGEYVNFNNWQEDAKTYGCTVKDERRNGGLYAAYDSNNQRVGVYTSQMGFLASTPQELQQKLNAVKQQGGAYKYSQDKKADDAEKLPGEYAKAYASVAKGAIPMPSGIGLEERLQYFLNTNN